MSASQRKIVGDYRHRGLECMCGNLRMASRALTSVYDAHLKPSGLTANQMAVLWCVLAREPTAMGEVAHVVVMDKTTVSRNMASLAAMGLVRTAVGGDARRRLVTSTARGRQAFAAAIPAWRAAQAEVAKTMGSARFSSLVRQARIAAAMVGRGR